MPLSGMKVKVFEESWNILSLWKLLFWSESEKIFRMYYPHGSQPLLAKCTASNEKILWSVLFLNIFPFSFFCVFILSLLQNIDSYKGLLLKWKVINVLVWWSKLKFGLWIWIWIMDYVKIHIDLLSTSLKCGYVKSYWIYNRQLNTKQNFHPIWAVSKLEKLCHSNAIVKYFAILNSTLEYWIKTPPAIWTSGLLNFPE